MAPHVPPPNNKVTGFANVRNWPQSNQPQLPSTIIGFRAINNTAIITFKQAPACPWQCLSLQLICQFGYSFDSDEWIRKTVINGMIHPMHCFVLYGCNCLIHGDKTYICQTMYRWIKWNCKVTVCGAISKSASLYKSSFSLHNCLSQFSSCLHFIVLRGYQDVQHFHLP